MILASLFAIALIVLTLLWHQKESQERQIRAQGVSLAQMLSGLPFEQLVAPLGQQSLLGTIFQSQKDRNFAYATIVNKENQPVSSAAAPGITVPLMDWPDTSVGWLSDRTVTTAKGENVIEFLAPVYADGAIAAYLRLGYVLPGMGISFEQVPFFATLALIIFLLTPLFYLLVRNEVRPLRQANAQISAAIESEQFRQIELGATEELSDFLGRFTTFVDFAKQRIDSLEHEQEKLVTSKNLITYSKSRIENVLEAIPEAVLILDQSGNVSFANRRISTILGVAHADVIGSEPSEWCNNAELLDVISRYSGEPEASYLSETARVEVGDKKQRQLSIKAYPLFSPTDSTNIYGSLIVFRDITRESAIQRQQGEFVAHVAHELKTPLNTLSLCTEALFDEGADDPASRVEAANIMHDEVERLAGLIDNLLSITKIETGQISVERQRLRLHDFLEDAFGVASRSDKARELTFELDLPPDVSSIMADKDLLRIAINNLLTNAVKYSCPGGVVSMSCEETEQTVRILVRDTGIGIDPDEQVRIFDRFYRSENAEARQRSGHGLGLSLARDIVQLHHGTLTVTSAPGEGSEFVIEIWKEAGLLKQVI
jgi:PAS domain S-box-containing protein